MDGEETVLSKDLAGDETVSAAVSHLVEAARLLGWSVIADGEGDNVDLLAVARVSAVQRVFEGRSECCGGGCGNC